MQSQVLKKYKIPDKSGVYFFIKKRNFLPSLIKEGAGGGNSKNHHLALKGTPPQKEGEEILYIGKATSLKDRVKSYFSKDLFNMRGPLLVDMMTKADKIKWQETDSVLEALILEANLIKKHQPYYNTKEKDDKSFNYVCITKEELPKVIIVRGREMLQKQENFSLLRPQAGPSETKNFPVSYASVFGPFPNGSQLKEALKIVRRIFPFLDDKSKNNYEFYKQLDLAPDIESRNMYLRNIKNIKLFFEGKKQKIFKGLEKEMQRLAKEHKFEEANEVKKQLFALKHINDVSLIKDDYARERFSGEQEGSSAPGRKSFSGSIRIESYDIAHMSGKNMVGVMTVVENGEPNKNEYRKFKIRNYENANDTGALLEMLERRFNHPEWQYPKLIVIDGGKAQLNVIKKFQNKVGLEIAAVSVVKDERHKPKDILGDKNIIQKYGREIILANAEAHRFAINYHRKLRGKLV